MFCYGLYGVMLVSAVALMTFADTISASNGFSMTLSDAQRASFDSPMHGNRAERHLRNHTKTIVDVADSSFEERSFEQIFTTGGNLIKMVMQKLKTFFNAMVSKPTIEQQVNQLFKTSVKLPDQEQHLVFSSQPFLDWTASVEELHQGNVEHANKAMVKTMAAQYGDDRLAEMLMQAKTSPKTSEEAKSLVTSLEEAQFQNWEDTDKFAVNVFKLLKLHEANDVSLENPLMQTWILSVKNRYPEEYSEKLWPVLKARYNDEVRLAKMLNHAKASPNASQETKDLAIKLEEAQFYDWHVTGKNAEGVYKLLELDQAGDVALGDPLVMKWTSFVRRSDEDNYSKVILSVLQNHYKDDAKLANMLIRAKESSLTKELATSLEEARLKDWLDSHKTAGDVFKLLKLDQADDVLLENPLVEIWDSFALKLTQKNHIKLMSSVSDAYDFMAKMPIRAKEDSIAKKAAARIDEGQIKEWMDGGSTAVDVYKLLKLDQQQNEATRKLLMKTWSLFVVKLDEKNHAKLMFLVLKDHYSDDARLLKMLIRAKESPKTKDLATRLEEAQINDWVDSGKTADHVSELFKSHKVDDAIKDQLEKIHESFLEKLKQRKKG